MINKPNEGENRKPSRLRFFLRLVLTIAVCGYCIFLNCRRCSVTAFAEGFETITLTPEQTIGLYGVNLPVKYSNINQVDQFFSAHLMGSALGLPHQVPQTSADSRLWDSNNWGPFNGMCNILWYWPISPTTAFEEQFENTEFLIYGINFSDVPFLSWTDINHPNIQIDIEYPFELTCRRIDAHLMFGRDPAARDSGWSSKRYVSSPMLGICQLLPSNDGRGISAFTPYPQWFSSSVQENQGCNTGLGVIHGGAGNLYGTTDYAITGEIWKFNGCATTPINLSFYSGDWLLIYVGCPKLYMDYVPPLPETTSPEPATTRADFTTYNYTYDLSPLETNQINQIHIQNQQLQIEMAQLDSLNYICKRLDDIYNDFIRSGDIPVDLFPGHEWVLGTDIENFIDSHITYTVATMNWQDIYRPVTGIYNFIGQYNFLDTFAVLGGISLAFGVFCWFIFRGRGG